MKSKKFEDVLKDSKEKPGGQLVQGKELLELIFTPESRPTLRWLHERAKQNEIPHVRLGGLVFFVPADVQKALTTERPGA